MEKHTILGGKVHVYKRDNSRFWQYSTYLAGRKRRASTHQELPTRAEEVAEDWYLELRGKVRAGELSGGRTFDQAAEQFLREYLVITGGERNAKYVEDHQSRLQRGSGPNTIEYKIWPAPGSKDTDLGVLMEPEVDHGEAEVHARVQA